MKLKSILLAVLIALSTLLFGSANFVKAESTNINSAVSQLIDEFRVEYIITNGIIWKIVYDSGGNVVQASAVSHVD